MLVALVVPPLATVQHARGLVVHTPSPTRAVFGEVVQLRHTAGVAMERTTRDHRCTHCAASTTR